MSTRSTRRPQVQTSLSPLESLLLAQATWELGAGPNSWPAIAKLLSKHPLLSRPKSFFSAQVRTFSEVNNMHLRVTFNRTHPVLSFYVRATHEGC